VEVDYHGPAHYDDPLVVDAHFTQMPTVRVPIDYTVYREGDDDALVTGHTTLCFTDAEAREPVRAPAAVREAFAPLLEE
jgi:acyl-CoA thioester hydrolase